MSDIHAILTRYTAGDLGWRSACKELQLRSHDELYLLLQKHELNPPSPLRDEVVEALTERISATYGVPTPSSD